METGTYKIEHAGLSQEYNSVTKTKIIHAAIRICLFFNTEVEVFAENPMWKTGDQLSLGRWVRVGYACTGKFHYD
jgi:hypothetical protein